MLDLEGRAKIHFLGEVVNFLAKKAPKELKERDADMRRKCMEIAIYIESVLHHVESYFRKPRTLEFIHKEKIKVNIYFQVQLRPCSTNEIPTSSPHMQPISQATPHHVPLSCCPRKNLRGMPRQ